MNSVSRYDWEGLKTTGLHCCCFINFNSFHVEVIRLHYKKYNGFEKRWKSVHFRAAVECLCVVGRGVYFKN